MTLRSTIAGPVAHWAAGPVRWFVSTAAMLVLAAFVVFSMQALVPGDTAVTILTLDGGPLPTPAEIAAKRAELNLDEPFTTRFLDWLSGAAHGDFGRSWSQPAEVSDLLGPRIATTAILALTSIAVALFLTLAVGLGSAMRPGAWFDRIARFVVVGVVAVPSFVLGLLVLQFVVLDLGVGRVMATPGAGASLPALLLGFVMAAGWARPFRAILIDAIAAPSVTVARARGMGRRAAVVRIALPNALLEFLPFVGLTIGGLLGATLLVEVVFSWPGAAAYAVEAARSRDLPVVQAFTLVSVAMFRLSTDLIRLLRWALDPRLRGGATSREAP